VTSSPRAGALWLHHGPQELGLSHDWPCPLLIHSQIALFGGGVGETGSHHVAQVGLELPVFLRVGITGLGQSCPSHQRRLGSRRGDSEASSQDSFPGGSGALHLGKGKTLLVSTVLGKSLRVCSILWLTPQEANGKSEEGRLKPAWSSTGSSVLSGFDFVNNALLPR
jgi:hypothetical protein